MPALKRDAGAASIDQQLADRVLAASSKPGNGTDRLPLAKQMEDFCSILAGKTVHNRAPNAL
jgi:hypothetical protein